MLLYSDVESFSETPIKCGSHRYAEAAEVMLWAYAIGDGPVAVWDLTTGDPMPADLKAALDDPECMTVWHNGGNFDRVVLMKALDIHLPVERIHDTMVRALMHSLPGSLDKLCEILRVPLDLAKSKDGKRLIRLFCVPRPKRQKVRRYDRNTHPAEWAHFVDYARLDIEAMREVYKRLPNWNMTPDEITLWHLDQKINYRGLTVDIEFIEKALAAIDDAQDHLADEAQRITDGAIQAATQRDAVLRFIFEKHGIAVENLRGETVERMLEDDNYPPELHELLRVRLLASTSSTAKYKKLRDCVSSDGRLRGALQFCGASRTGRWAGRLAQFQNLPRGSIRADAVEAGITALKANDYDEIFEGPVIELASNALRGTIVAADGKLLRVADLANIEGRVLAWLAGEQWKLQAFAEYDKGIGEDLYKITAGRILGKPAKVISKKERQEVGKVSELALGYEGGVGAFITFATAYGIDLYELADIARQTVDMDVIRESEGLWHWMKKNKNTTYGLPFETWVGIDGIKRSWRLAHPAISSFWKALADAARAAIMHPGKRFDVKRVSFVRNGAWLRCILPSGRSLCYPAPEVDETGQVSYLGVNQYSRQWSRLKTYGGKLCLAGDTLVLTSEGWIAITDISPNLAVWDGEEWVDHDGVVMQGHKETIELDGVAMTPDHLVLTEKGWRDASSSAGYHRSDFWLPDGSSVCGQQRPPFELVVPLRMRGHGGSPSERCDEARKEGRHAELRVLSGHPSKAHDARDEPPSGLRGLAIHARKMSETVASGLAQLRRARDHSLRQLAIFRELLARHGSHLPSRAYAGSTQQRSRLLAQELPMGYPQGAGAKYAQGAASRHDRLIKSDRRAYLDASLSVGTRPVYDLTNAGPRSRFVVLGATGPFIVHNCENITQAVARDVLAHGMLLVDENGFDIGLTVHDEIIAESDEWGPDHAVLAQLMATNPLWAAGLPLAAGGFSADRYRKD